MQTSQQHRHLLAIPHRRPAYGVNAPALFRHTGFRIEEPGENPLTAVDDAASSERRERFIHRLNEALLTIQKTCAVAAPHKFTLSQDNDREEMIPATNTLLEVLERLPDELAGWRCRMRVDIHSEYYFITFILDQKSGRACVADIEAAERDLSTKGCSAIDTKWFIRRFYEDVWSILERHLKSCLDMLPGRRFTEFRSIALRDTESPFVKDRDESLDRFTIPEIDASTFKQARSSLREWLARNAPCIREILQIDEFTKDIDQDANCVLCEMLKGAGVYGSSVRQLPPRRSGQAPLDAQAKADGVDDFQPLRYFLLYNGLSKYQLGRLVRRTHVMGELRVAAVLDAPLLHQASSCIRSLGNKIDKLLTDRDGEPTLTDTELDAVLKELNRISSMVPGGLIYRINRSRYYAKSFRDHLSDLRVRRLEGWQPYNEFFQRNLYQVFDEIDQIGNRYAALSQRVTRLTIARNTERQRQSQEHIRTLVREMSAADRTIARIQELGELISFVAVTYYGGHIVSDVLHALCGGDRILSGYFIAAAFALGVGYYWHQKRHGRRGEA